MKCKRCIIILSAIVLATAVFGYKSYNMLAVGSSALFYADNKILYNNISGDICAYDAEKDTYETLLKNKTLIFADKDYILCKNADTVYIYNISDLSLCDFFGNVNITYGEIHKNILYFVDENKRFYKAKLGSTARICRNDIKTEHFRIYNDTIYYESNNHIYSCDIYGEEKKEIYSGLYGYFFDIDGDFLYLSDYSQDGLIIAVDTKTGNIEKTYGISATQFCVNNKKIYYVDYISETQYISRFMIRPKGAKIKVG